MIATVLLSPPMRHEVLAAPFGLVVALDPDMLSTICVVPVIPRRDDITFTSRQLLVSRCWRRSLHVGRVIGCNLPIGNGPLLEQAPAMAHILRELVAGVPVL
jgi:hypothetical protein